jgi:hypothetical protein
MKDWTDKGQITPFRYGGGRSASARLVLTAEDRRRLWGKPVVEYGLS